MNTKSIVVAMFVPAIAAFAAVTPEVSGVDMIQSSSSRLVTITYTLANAPAVVTLDIETNCVVDGETVWTSIGGQAVCNAQGAVWRKVVADDLNGEGKAVITWRPDLSWPDHKIAAGGARAVVTAWALDNTPDYMVVDIFEGAAQNSQKYYPAADFLPGGLLSNDSYRTSAIVMRKIMAKGVPWTMGSPETESGRTSYSERPHIVTLTNNYYIGVFEMTQAQWGCLPTNRKSPSCHTNMVGRSLRPVENVCFNEIRLSNTATENLAYEWPADPNTASFLGLLRTRTGLDFDLPSDAQWEFAARAGNGTGKWGDGTAYTSDTNCTNLNHLGRNAYNGGKVFDGENYTNSKYDCTVENGTAICGTYVPNSWGIYDMHGNVAEWCLDWYVHNNVSLGGAVNTTKPASEAARVRRGAHCHNGASSCRLAARSSDAANTRYYQIGFRVVCRAGLD